MSLHYLLDGYNILYQIPEFQDRELEAQRQGLIDRIAAAAPQGKNRVTVVFDGRPGRSRPREAARVEVVFTDTQTADEWIKDRVERSLNSKTFVVVTNDREIQYAVRREGAAVLEVKEFWAKCRPKKPGVRAPQDISSGEKEQITEELKDIWLKKKREDA